MIRLFALLLAWLCLPDARPVVATTPSQRIRETVDSLAGVQSRISGYPGSDAATEFVERRLRAAGVVGIVRDEFDVTIPVDRGSELLLDDTGERLQLRGMWPNLVRTTTTPPDGLIGPLVYGADGSYRAIDGKPMAGRVVLLDFNSWYNWLNVASLGARAVVFIEPKHTSWSQADSKYAQLPLDLPRFWISRGEGQRLRDQIGDGEVQVTIKSRMDWERRPTWNVWGRVPGNDPVLKDESIIVEAYYDGISVVPSLAPSAETACSIAGLLELAEHLRRQPPARTVILLATAAHFQDQLGMVDFLDRHARKSPYYAKRLEMPLDPDLFISLDLSSQTDRVGIWNNTSSYDLKRFFVPFGRRFTAYAEEFSPKSQRQVNIPALANGISPIKGMDWSTFVPGGVSVNSVRALRAGIVSLAFVSINDSRFVVDTPLDVPGKVKFDNLERQISLLNSILGRAFSDADLFANLEDFDPVLKDELRSMRAKVRAWPRRSTKPDRPVPDAIFAVVGGGRVLDRNFKSHKGVRATRFYMTDHNGDVDIDGLYLGHRPLTAYVLDAETGDIVYAPDHSKRASASHGGASNGWLGQAIRWDTHEKMVVVFPCVSRPFYGLIDPQSLTALRGINVIDRGGRPAEQFSYAVGWGLHEPVGVLFGPNEQGRDNAVKLLIGSRMMLLNSQGSDTERQAKGIGFLLERDELVPTPLLALKDMWDLNEARINTMRAHAIENQRLKRLHERSRVHIDKAEDALDAARWEDYVAQTRAALGLTAKAYPDAKGTLNDVIRGMVFFLALLIPAAFFAERLLVAASDIRRQLVAFALLLAMIWLVLSQIHPAFQIAHPMVILLGFAIMSMSLFVLSLLSGRFNVFMREHKARTAHVHETDISRSSATYAAFMLGISNMRRRKLRTTLTLITLTLLTFTVLSFTSFRQQIRFMAFSLGHSGAYEGVLVRSRGWSELSPPVLDYVESHFGDSAVVCPRNWYISPAGGEKRYIEVGYDASSYKATGLLGLSPREGEISGIQRSIKWGTFFDSDQEETCLISQRMAEHLGIASEDVGMAMVRVFGRDLTVRGIFTADSFDAIVDLDDEPLSPVDFQSSSTESLGPTSLVSMEAPADDEVMEIRPFVHLQGENVLIMPYEILREAGGTLRSVALRFAEDVAVLEAIERFLTRITISLFAGVADGVSGDINVFSYTSLDTPAVEGLGALMVPMLIAALIVLNAMLGAVYERFREIGVYSSVGLAPMHIALLFIAEACVYAVLGVTMGYIVGQSLGKILISLDLLQGMNLNYSSMSAILSASLVMAVVLLSTIYPARVAERTAVPDMIRRWAPPLPEGDRWQFPFPFMISEAEVEGACGFLANYFSAYSEESIGQFYADKVEIMTEDGETGREYAVRMLLWMAPFDMGVSQYMQIEFAPGNFSGAYAIEIFIQRISGQDTFWQRVNHKFMNQLRKEFLIWNTLDAESKEFHRHTAVEMLSQAQGEGTVA